MRTKQRSEGWSKTHGSEGEVVNEYGGEEEGSEGEEDGSEKKLIHFVNGGLHSITEDVKLLAC